MIIALEKKEKVDSILYSNLENFSACATGSKILLHLKILAAPSIFVFFNIFFILNKFVIFFIKYFNFFNSLYFYEFMFLIYCIHSPFLNSSWRHFLISYFF